MQIKFLLAILLLSLSSISYADDNSDDSWLSYDHLVLNAGAYTHFGDDPEYDGKPILVSLEAHKSNDWLYGLALFDNSFGQFSQYAYVAKLWRFSDTKDGFYGKLSGGFIHGYKDEYEDKIPLNSLGVAPAIIPGVGYKKGRYGTELVLFGTAGVLWTFGLDL